MEVLTDGFKSQTVYPLVTWNQVMKMDLDMNEIDKLESLLQNFKTEWNELQNKRAKKWRRDFFLGMFLTVLISVFNPLFWWSTIFVISYFAGTLYTMLKQNNKTSQQITEHQKQLRLVKLLRNFETLQSYPEK